MILFLQHAADGQRGGEKYTGRLHRFLVERFGQVEPVELTPLPARHRSIPSHARASLQTIRRFHPKLVITDVSSGARNVLAVNWARRNGVGVMVIIQEQRMTFRLGSKAPVRWAVRACENYLLRSADIILVNSNYIASFAKARSREDCAIILARPGIQIIDPPSPKADFHEKPMNQLRRLLAVGEWTEPRKGIKYLFEGLPLLGDLNIQLDLAGGYNEQSRHYQTLRNIVEKQLPGKQVNILGFLNREQLSQLYADADILVLPSLSEGYGMAMAEALAYGLPVVATSVAAIPEMIEDGVNGILVPPRDPAALAEAIRRLVKNPLLADKIRRANLEKARTLPTWDDFDRTLERELVPVVERLLGPKSE